MRLAIDIIQDFIPLDTLLHLLIAYLVLTLVGGIATWWIGVVVTQIFIFGKEFLDKKSYGHFCWKDILAGEAGVAMGLLLLYLV